MHRNLVFLLLLSGCTSLPEAQWRIDERIERTDRQLGRAVFEKIKSKIVFLGDEPTDSYLSEMGNKLIRKSTKLSESPLSVYAVKDEGSESAFGLPGARVFISTRLIKDMEYESVLAAALAFEIGKIEVRSLMKKLEEDPKSPPSLEWAKESPSIRELSEAAKNAVQILYFSGYDPRGLVSYWKLLQNSKKTSPIDPRSLKILIELSFEESTTLPPLMKPVVKSEQFLMMRKRWSQKL